MAALEIDNPFWRFSLRVYASPGVAEECIEAQDKFGIDVNVVLYTAWLGATRGVILRDIDLQRIAATVESWSAGVVRPLRSVRRGLKQMPEIAVAEVQALRKRVADTELLAEQVEQAFLFRLTGEFGEPLSEPDGAAHKNVAAMLALYGADVDPIPLRRLLAAADVVRD